MEIDLRGASPVAVTRETRNVTNIVNSGHIRERDINLVMPLAPLEAVMSGEVWATVYDQLARLIEEHHTTLVFANTRRMVERVSRHLAERLGEQNVAAHHGSLSKETRFDAEQRLKAGKLKVMVATASLELGIDIGDVELVCQLGTPRSISVFLQRVGRANHSVHGIPKGRIFPASRDELVDCVALLDSVRRGELDRLHIPEHPLDVLSQQIVAEVSAREYGEEELFALVRSAYPYRNLERKDFDAVVRMLADGVATRRGRRGTYLHRDAVNHVLRARKGARLTAITCGGAIPDNADYQVILEPAGIFVGTLNEDFAIESLAGDIFQLGNTSYRILRVEAGRVRVEDAKGQPPSIPFWLGEAPARTDELVASVSRLRADIEALLPEVTAETIARAIDIVAERYHLVHPAAQQLVEYLGSAKAVLGKLPTRGTLVFERFFDESGGQQLVIHAPFGARINRAFGLSLRKKFCRTFNFELQAAATEDAIVLSLGETHSFELASVARFLSSKTVEDTLIQAMLDSPMFTARWRWNASISLAIRRSSGGKRTPPQIQRMAAEDLIAVVFPDQIACAENLSGPREIPDHPLVKQTLEDCLHEAMDVEGLKALLRGLEDGTIQVVAKDLPTPSPLAAEILGARPYAFLDDAPLEERRTNAVSQRRWLDPESAADMGKLDPAAIAQVRAEAWPEATNADELHDALNSLGLLTAAEGMSFGWATHLEQLIAARRATRLHSSMDVGDRVYWVCAECLPMIQAIYPNATLDPPIAVPAEILAARQWTRETAVTELVRGRLQGLGPVTARDLVESLDVEASCIEVALAELEGEGFVLRGRFTEEASAPEVVGAGDSTLEWCERRLLARIHRYTIKTLRAEIEPVSGADFMRFLFEWQGVTRRPKPEGVESLAAVITQLEGYEVPAAAWEGDVLPARLNEYDPHWLDSLCLAGRALWARLTPAKSVTAAPVRTTPIALVTRRNWSLWHALAAAPREEVQLSHGARALYDYFNAHGASFFDDLVSGAKLLRTQAETALGELVSAGLVNADSYSGLRALLIPSDKRRQLVARRRRVALFGLEDAGRWSLIRKGAGEERCRSARAGGADPAAPLRRGVSQGARARGGLAAALARAAAGISPARGAGKDSRRALRRGYERRTIRVARCGRVHARDSPAGSQRRLRFTERRGSAQSHRHRHAGCTRAVAHQQPRAVSRRRASGGAFRGAVRVHRRAAARQGVGGAAGAGAQAHGRGPGQGELNHHHRLAVHAQPGLNLFGLGPGCAPLAHGIRGRARGEFLGCRGPVGFHGLEIGLDGFECGLVHVLGQLARLRESVDAALNGIDEWRYTRAEFGPFRLRRGQDLFTVGFCLGYRLLERRYSGCHRGLRRQYFAVSLVAEASLERRDRLVQALEFFRRIFLSICADLRERGLDLGYGLFGGFLVVCAGSQRQGGRGKRHEHLRNTHRNLLDFSRV